MDDTFDALWEKKDPFYEVEQLNGKVYRALESRKTLRFELNGKPYFIKIHRGVSWRYILSDLIRLRRPILGAENEWLAIKKLTAANVPTMTVAAYGNETTWNPARRHSFIVTHSLEHTISLEDLGNAFFKEKPSKNNKALFKLKRALIKQVASMSRAMHCAGVNHRDFYLCHFLLHWPGCIKAVNLDHLQLWLIDLHRSQIRKEVPQRWLEKDLAALYFSSFEFGLTRRDCLRFIVEYTQLPLRQAIQQKRILWAVLQHKAEKLYLRYQKRFVKD